MQNRTLGIDDVIKDDSYLTVPKNLFWDKKVREGTKPAAKLLYGWIRDRWNLSAKTTREEIEKGKSLDELSFADGKDIYCILDNTEIELLMQTTNKTVKEWIDSLVKFDLIEVRPVKGGANRIFLKVIPDKEYKDMYISFRAELDYARYVKQRKKNKLEIEKKFDYFLNKRLEESKSKNNNVSEAGDKVAKTGDNLGDNKGEEPVNNGDKANNGEDEKEGVGKAPTGTEGQSPTVTEGEFPTGGKENFLPSNTKDTKPDPINPELRGTDDTTTRDAESQTLVVGSTDVVTNSDNYQLLDDILDAAEIFTNIKDRNIIKKALKDENVKMFHRVCITRTIGGFSQLVKDIEKQGKPVRCMPALFGKSLRDRIIEAESVQRAEQYKKAKAEYEPEQKSGSSIVFYNWVE